MHTKLAILTTLAALTVMSHGAAATTVPTSIPLSGLLTDADGKPLHGINEVAIIWFDRDGKEIADETLEVDGGRLDHMSAKDEIARAALNGSLAEVELVINGEVMEPRIALGSVPYALRAAHAAQADSASSAVHADSATSCMMLGDLSPDYFLPAHQMTWARLPDKPLFKAQDPFFIHQTSGSNILNMGINPCADNHTLVSQSSQWSCLPHTSASSLANGSTTLAASTQDTLEVAPGSLSSVHISASGLTSSSIQGNAIVSYSPHDQWLMNTRIWSNGQVSIGPSLALLGAQLHPHAQLQVEGLLTADAFSYPLPQQRELLLAPEHFRLRGSHYDQNIELASDGSLFMSYGWSSVTVSAPLALPADAQVALVSCQRLLTAGSLAGSKLRVVEIGSLGSLTRTVLAEYDMGDPFPSNQLQGWESGPIHLDLSRTTSQPTTSRFVVELEWRADQPGPHAKLAHCTVEYTSTSL